MKPSALITLFKSDAPQEVARRRDPNLPATDRAAADRRARRGRQVLRYLRRRASFIAIVILPTLLASIYYLVWASDQYMSEARFVIRGQTATPSLLGQMFSMASGTHTAEEELLSVGDYMKSVDAVKQLQDRMSFAELYRRKDADWFARLPDGVPIEELLDYYLGMVAVSFDTQTGIAILRVRAFRPEDAQNICNTLLTLGEELVNRFSERQRNDTLKIARNEVERSEDRVVNARKDITAFRDRERSLDPGRSSLMVMDVISKLEIQLAQTRTELIESATYLKPDNAKFVALRNKADAIESQIVSEKKKLAGGDGTLAPMVARYERLQLEREFADKGYASSLVSLETARIEALKQHLYLVRIVEPNLAEKALYPRRWIILATLLLGSFIVYGIGWLIIAGVREHAA
jgi:capsular polysaccharide transport system permease protein